MARRKTDSPTIQVGWRFDAKLIEEFEKRCEGDLYDPRKVLEFLIRNWLRGQDITPSSRSGSRSAGELPPSAEPPEVGERHTPFDPGPSLERKEVEDARATPRSRKKHEPTKK